MNMTEVFVVIVMSLIGSLVQSVSGFGCGVVMMMVFPAVFGMLRGTALCAAISAAITISMLIQFRKYSEPKKVILPIIFYLTASLNVIRVVDKIDTHVLSIVFGCFLLTLGVYYLFIAKKAKISANPLTMALCSLSSGFFGGMFGIGGPPLALYMLAVTDDHNHYIGCIQSVFLFSTTLSTYARFKKGFFTVDMIPLAVIGMITTLIGLQIGLRFSDKLDEKKLLKAVYLCIGLSGVIILVQNLF